MVKRQKEKQYQSATEHRANSQIRSGNQPPSGSEGGGGGLRRLPFNCCALSLMPFTTPVCTSNGIVFEKTAIEPFLAEHKIDPVTGNPMTKHDLIVLNMSKDEEGRWQCPILTKPFADHTKVIAIRQNNPPGTEANVYSFEAYQELNVKAKNYEDLVSGQKFNKKKDVIFLNNPDDEQFNKVRDINSFFQIQNQRKLEKTAAPQSSNIRLSVTATRILDKLNKDNKNTDSKGGSSAESKKRSQQQQQQEEDLAEEGKRLKIFSDDVRGVKMTAGKASGSLTSTVMEVTYDNETREATEEEILQSMFQVLRRQKKKGYVKLETNIGPLLLEIHCDMVPRTATNFMKLCDAKKYKGSSFHRLIPNFMIQGGKPSKELAAEGETDDSIWGEAFRDEFDARLKHDGPGVLSMANAGPNTNRRQFFITFKSCEHLNKKHSVFGAVIGEGLEVLKKMEKIPTDKKNRPLQAITIIDTIVVENPVKQAEEAEIKRIEAKRQKVNDEKVSSDKNEQKQQKSNNAASPANTTSQIGKYLKKTTATRTDTTAAEEDIGTSASIFDLKKVKPKTGPTKPISKFGNFSGW